MKALVKVSVLSMLFSGVGAAGAAEQLLTLDDAVEAAIGAAPQLQAQRAALEGAQAYAISAGRLPDPELVAGIDNLPSSGMDAWLFGRDFMTMRKIGLMQSFPNRHKRRSEKESARAMVAVAESEAAQTRLELTQSVAQAWVSRYSAEVAVNNLQQLKPQLALQVELASVAVASGRATVSDALSAQAAAADLDDRLLDARREVVGAQAELARWIGDAADRSLAVPPSYGELHGNAAELLSSVHHHAALLAYDARIAFATSDIAVANAAKRPDWSAELDYAWRGRGFADMVSLQFQVALPLFPGARQEPAVHARRAAVKQLEADRETELRMHIAEISKMLSEWQSAKQRIELYERQRLPLARQRSELALAGLRAGRMELRQTLGVLTDQIEVERSYVELLKTLGLSWTYLRYLPTQGEVR
jgi:outer membrane protein, heavy metal efflux system